MKARRLMFMVVLAMVATLCLAGSAAADPPKANFYFRWGYFLDGVGCDLRVTGVAAHCPGQWYKVQIYSTTNPLVSGTMEFWFDTDNLGWPDPWGWFWRERFQGGWRIQPDGIDGYWEGNLTKIGTGFDWYQPISKMEGKGYGALSGYLIKSAHWLEPADPSEESPYGTMWPVNGGVIIMPGKQ